jgi:ribosomal protein S18 acetylase RimI-like enzyme
MAQQEAVEYRRATEGDLDGIFELWWEMQSSHIPYDRVWYGPRSKSACRPVWFDHVRNKLSDENSLIFIATVDGRPVGMVVGFVTDRPPVVASFKVLAIENAVVAEKFRQRGILRRLMATITAEARSRAVKAIKLSVHTANPARHAYERLGFACQELTMMKYIQ